MTEPHYKAFLPELGLDESAVAQILEGARFSAEWLRRARTAWSEAGTEEWQEGAAIFVLGSLARYEASTCSDVDLGVVYLDNRFDVRFADNLWSSAVERLAALGLKVEQKTFNQAWPLSKFLTNIGGTEETNTALTYRALLLTEAAWVFAPSVATEIRTGIFTQYAAGIASRGKHLTSLSNDLHRYYRTLCVDYRHKVEEKGKPWAMRVLKLRHSRKLWHLGNIAAQCTALGADNHDALLAERIGEPPLLKVATALRTIGQLSSGADLFAAYNTFLTEIGKDDVRQELEALEYGAHEQSEVYRHLRENARVFQTAASRVWRALVGHEPYQDYLERYVIL